MGAVAVDGGRFWSVEVDIMDALNSVSAYRLVRDDETLKAQSVKMERERNGTYPFVSVSTAIPSAAGAAVAFRSRGA